MARRNVNIGIDIMALSQRIEGDLAASIPLSRDCSIYKVPEIFFRGNEFAFKPLLVSIGPYHFRKQKLLPMEKHKRRYFAHFCQRTQVSRHDCLKFITETMVRVRKCYAEETDNLSDEDFVYMILMDASFIIELFLKLFVDYESLHSSIVETTHDLFLLENQLPFFILEDLFNFACGNLSRPNGQQLSMIYLARSFCRLVWENPPSPDAFVGDVRPTHLLDLLRMSYALPITTSDTSTPFNMFRPTKYTATQLHLSGVKFKSSPSNNLFDITFRNGILEIPKLRIITFTETWIRNMMVLEQLEPNGPFFMSQYMWLMNFFVNAPKDVEILTTNEIIQTLFEPQRVSTLFQDIMMDCVVGNHNFYFAPLLVEMGTYCSKSWRKWKVNLLQNYLNTPWSGIKVIAAILAFLIGIGQLFIAYLKLKQKPG